MLSLDDSYFFMNWSRKELHVVHQGAPHANIMTPCMWHVCKYLRERVEVRGIKMTFMLKCHLGLRFELGRVPAAGPFGRAGGSD